MNRRERRLAAKQAKAGVAVTPSSGAVAAFNQGVRLQQQGQLRDAALAFRQASKLTPQFFEAHQALAQLCYQGGQFDQAVQAYEAALALRPDATDCQTGLAQILRRAQPLGYQATLDTRLRRLFDSPAVKHQDLALVAAATLRQKHDAVITPAPEDPRACKALLEDRLLIQLLCKTVLVDRELELLLTAVRRGALLSDTGAQRLPKGLLLALAWQTTNNAGAWFQDADEQAQIQTQVARLADGLEKRRKGDAVLEAELLLIAAYQPLDRLACFERLRQLRPEGWSRDAQPFFAQALDGHAAEQEAAAAIQPYAPTSAASDQVSRRVREMYEESPYPRWLHLDQLPAMELGTFLAQRLTGFKDAAQFNGAAKMLVAGCGTGRQVVTLARCHRKLEITAFDLSRRSLGYAQLMAARYGVENCRFYQGNILDLPGDGGETSQAGETGETGNRRRYDVVVCTGVLHHLADPLAGWAALVSSLRPGGLMQIALYSKQARRHITQARQRVTQLGLQDDPNGIRAFRRRILLQQETQALNDLAAQADFADLNGCRDLIFHRQESCYRLPEIAAALAELGLTFLGFDFSEPDLPLAFKAAFPASDSQRDLGNWEKFEADNPDSFLAMYNFWCRKD